MVKGMPRCKQPIAKAMPPIPAPMIATCGKFSSGTGKFSAGIMPEPEQSGQIIKVPSGRIGAVPSKLDASKAAN